MKSKKESSFHESKTQCPCLTRTIYNRKRWIKLQIDKDLKFNLTQKNADRSIICVILGSIAVKLSESHI